MLSINLIDAIGLFLFLAGFVIGLGAVTVIDIHGFLGRKSSYWTEAKVSTKISALFLIRIGSFLREFKDFAVNNILYML